MLTENADITIASTTETQAELDHATGERWREQFKPAAPAAGEQTETPAEETANADGSTKTRPASETGRPNKPGAQGESGSEKDDDDVPLPKGVQKRIDRLTARLTAAERQLQERPATRETPQPKPVVKTDPEPVQKDFKSWEEWQEARARWAVRDEQRKTAVRETQEAEEQRSRENYDAHLDRIETSRADHDDFDETVKAAGTFEFASPQANVAFQLAIIEADNGPEVLYHLSKHPEELAKFAGLSAVKTQLMVGRISAALSPSTSTDGKPAAGAPKPAARSTTPAPTTPVRRTTTATGTSYLDPATSKKMSDDEWIRAREQDARKSRKH